MSAVAVLLTFAVALYCSHLFGRGGSGFSLGLAVISAGAMVAMVAYIIAASLKLERRAGGASRVA